MKQAKGMAAALAGFLAIYLLGVFYSVSFDISTWEDPVRFGIALLGGCAAAFSYAVTTH